MFEFGAAEMAAFLQVVFIDIILAGDNAIVVGIAAAGMPAHMRQKVIFYGIAGAVVLRILMALIAVQLLQIVGLVFAGGVLLLWVSWKFYRELRHGAQEHAGAEAMAGDLDASEAAAVPQKTFREAMWQIIIADFSMSLDNVLAVAGSARDHPYIMVFGLILSIALMAIAATVFARLLDRHRWLAWAGLLVILYVAAEMMWEGGFQIAEAVAWV